MIMAVKHLETPSAPDHCQLGGVISLLHAGNCSEKSLKPHLFPHV